MRAVFNAMVRRERQWPGVGGRRDSWIMKHLHPDWDLPRSNLTLGALPLPLFANGHGYFVQSAHVALGVQVTLRLDLPAAYLAASRHSELPKPPPPNPRAPLFHTFVAPLTLRSDRSLPSLYAAICGARHL